MKPDGEFACIRCGTCCGWPGHVFLTDEDVARLARRVGMEERPFVDRYARVAPNRAELVLAEREDGACVFLEQGLCKMYEVRPKQCRDFPLVWRVAGPCPGAGATRSPVPDGTGPKIGRRAKP